MKTIEQTRRELFEAALHRDWATHLVVLDRKGDGYVFGDIDSAWWAFNAGLDSVVIQLPDDGLEDCERDWGSKSRNDFDTGYSYASMRHESAIESTNLGLKIK